MQIIEKYFSHNSEPKEMIYDPARVFPHIKTPIELGGIIIQLINQLQTIGQLDELLIPTYVVT